MDILQRYHEFAKKVASALNEKNIQPLDEEFHYAVMVVVHPKERTKGWPVGGALNLIEGQWKVQEEMAEVGPVAVSVEQG